MESCSSRNYNRFEADEWMKKGFNWLDPVVTRRKTCKEEPSIHLHTWARPTHIKSTFGYFLDWLKLESYVWRKLGNPSIFVLDPDLEARLVRMIRVRGRRLDLQIRSFQTKLLLWWWWWNWGWWQELLLLLFVTSESEYLRGIHFRQRMMMMY